MDCLALADEIIAGRRLGRGDDLQAFITVDIDGLKEGADRLRKHFCGDKVDLCTIISGRSGKCGENCKFCAQAAGRHTGCEVYDLLDDETIIETARANQAEGVDRFAIVTSGKSPSPADFERIVHVFEKMHRESYLGAVSPAPHGRRHECPQQYRDVTALFPADLHDAHI